MMDASGTEISRTAQKSITLLCLDTVKIKSKINVHFQKTSFPNTSTVEEHGYRPISCVILFIYDISMI